MPLLRAKELDRHHRQGADRARAVRRAAGRRARARPRPRCRDARAGAVLRNDDGADALEARAGRQAGDVRERRHRGRRRRADRVHLGHDRQAEGHDALPPRRDRDVRLLAAPVLQARAGRRLHAAPAARLHVRPRRAAAASRCASAPRRCCRAAHARDAARRPSSASAPTVLLHRADVVPRDGARSAEASTSSRLRKCVSAGEALPAATRQLCKRGDRHRDHRRHRRRPRCSTSSSRTRRSDVRPGATGKPVPGYRACVMDDDGNPLPAGHGRPARGEGPDRLPLPRRRPRSELRAATAGTTPATPTSWTPTATSSTRRAPTT